MKKEEKVKDMTVKILISIRDEITKLREDTNARFEQMDRRFEQMDRRFERIEKDISVMKQSIKAIATHFDRDYLILSGEVEKVKNRITLCEKEISTLKQMEAH